VNGQERIIENRLIRENIKRQAINTFRTKKHKLKMKKREGDWKLERKKLVNQWINDQKKKGHVFKFRTRARTPWEQSYRPFLPSQNNWGP
jgi:hypothetical protein